MEPSAFAEEYRPGWAAIGGASQVDEMMFVFDLQRFADDPEPGPEPEPGSTPEPEPEPEPTPDPEPEPPKGKDEPPEVVVLRKELEKVRKEAAKYRTERKSYAEQIESLKAQIAKALGLKGDEPPDPDKLAKELESVRTRYRRERLRNALYRQASRLEADPELTWAVLYASGDLDNLDVDEEDFESQVAERVQAALEAHPKLKVTPTKPGVGGPTNPGPDGGNKPTVYTREQLQRMSPDEINANWDEIQKQLRAGIIK